MDTNQRPPEMLDESSQTGQVGMSTVDHILIVHSAGRKLDLEEIWGPKNGVVSNCKDLVTFCIRGRAYWIHSLTLSITTKFILSTLFKNSFRLIFIIY